MSRIQLHGAAAASHAAERVRVEYGSPDIGPNTIGGVQHRVTCAKKALYYVASTRWYSLYSATENARCLFAGTTSWVGTVADNDFSIVALTTGPTGIVSGSIMMRGETHNIDYREGSTYSVYKVRRRFCIVHIALHCRMPAASTQLLPSPYAAAAVYRTPPLLTPSLLFLTPPLLFSPQVDDGMLPAEHPKPVIPPGVKQVYKKPQHLDSASRPATKAPTPAPTAANAASSHLNKAATATGGRKLMQGRRELLETPGQVDVGIFWTGNAQNAVGGKPQMQAKIRAAVVATNAVYAASKLKLRLRLVYMGAHLLCVLRNLLPSSCDTPEGSLQ